MEENENQADTLNEIKKKLHSIYLTLITMFLFGLLALMWAVLYLAKIAQPST
jgi:uncharacterized BrkB/YihY/UPF0761 family membrane protein